MKKYNETGRLQLASMILRAEYSCRSPYFCKLFSDAGFLVHGNFY